MAKDGAQDFEAAEDCGRDKPIAPDSDVEGTCVPNPISLLVQDMTCPNHADHRELHRNNGSDRNAMYR